MNGKSIQSFFVGVLLVAIIWGAVRAGSDPKESQDPELGVPEKSDSVRMISSQGQAPVGPIWGPYSHVENMPPEEVMLEIKKRFPSEEKVRKSGGITREREALIIRLAQIDPKQAMKWVDEFFASGSMGSLMLSTVCDLVSAEWAHQDPEAFMKFINDGLESGRSRYTPMSEARFDMIFHSSIEGWIRCYIESRGGVSDDRFLSSLKSVEACQQGVEVVEDYLDDQDYGGYYRDGLLTKIVNRWIDIDEEGFREASVLNEAKRAKAIVEFHRSRGSEK